MTLLDLSTSFRGARSVNYDAQLRIGESRDSGSGPSDHPGMMASAPRLNRLLGLVARLRFDLADRIDHGIEGQHRRGMARLVIAHRLKQCDVGPLALRGAAV